MKTILASAYDINPFKGSESGTGWNFILQIARSRKVLAITRKNNKSEIERYIKEKKIDTTNIQFYYFDLPYFLRFWKRGPKGSFLYYNLWQFGLIFFIWLKKLKFDISQHVNFHADHVPSFLWVFRKPFIWGPISHNELIPTQFISSKYIYFQDRLRFLIKFLRWKFDPFIYLCKKNSSIIIGGNSSVQSRLNVSDNKFVKLSTVGSYPFALEKTTASDSNMPNIDSKFRLISVGRFVPIKSFDISINAFDSFYKLLPEEDKQKVELILIGDGPLYDELEEISNKLECRSAINFIKWIDQEKLFELYKISSVLLAPSHEGAGAVIGEAQSAGLPVICFKNFGAGELISKKSGIVVEYQSYYKSYISMGNAIKVLFDDKSYYDHLRKGAINNYYSNLSWNSKGNKLEEVYTTIIKNGEK